jgi:hypothetical protein
MKQVGPGPATTALPGGGAPAPGARRSPQTIWVVVIVVVTAGWLLLRPHENKTEQLATQVTQAIIKNDMHPVEKDFNALARPELENRGRVGRLSDQLVALGALKSVKEDTAKDAPAGVHHFVAQFDKATWVEDLKTDADGKISAFEIHPPDNAGK